MFKNKRLVEDTFKELGFKHKEIDIKDICKVDGKLYAPIPHNPYSYTQSEAPKEEVVIFYREDISYYITRLIYEYGLCNNCQRIIDKDEY